MLAGLAGTGLVSLLALAGLIIEMVRWGKQRRPYPGR
jgi:hypothetical protein